MLTAERAHARARAERARRAAEIARMRRRNRGDVRTRTARVLRDVAGRLEPDTARAAEPRAVVSTGSC